MKQGFTDDAIRDYEEYHIFDRFDTPQGRQLLAIVDPYSYRDRCRIPKFLIHSSGDQFFLPDSAQFYLRDLAGPTYVRYCPNTDHGLGSSDADKSLLAFYQSVLQCLPYAYKFGLDGDRDVDMADVALLAAQWLTEGTVADVAPACGDRWVDFLDYAALTSEMTN